MKKHGFLPKPFFFRPLLFCLSLILCLFRCFFLFLFLSVCFVVFLSSTVLYTSDSMSFLAPFTVFSSGASASIDNDEELELEKRDIRILNTRIITKNCISLISPIV